MNALIFGLTAYVLASQPAAAAGCTQARIDAHVTRMAPLEFPDPMYAWEPGAAGTTLVEVQLSDTGAVQGLSVLRSSGYRSLDAQALKAASLNEYAPDVIDCHGVAGDFIFKANFVR